MNRKPLSTLLIIGAISVLESSSRAEEVSLSNLSGAKIDNQWFRYVNRRFGLAIDIPTQGYRYEVPINGSGLTLTSRDKATTITIYAHWVINVVDNADNVVSRSVSQLFDKAVNETLEKRGTVEYSVKKDEFYVISGRFGNDMYYERLTVSPNCPAIFNTFRIFHPLYQEKTLDALVTRMSKSLTATCRGEEGAAYIK